MCVTLRMHVSCGTHKLLEDMLASIFRQTLVFQLLNVVIDAHTLAELHDQVHMGSLIDYFVQLHYIRVP